MMLQMMQSVCHHSVWHMAIPFFLLLAESYTSGFVDLEKACGPDCILSTNTSTIDIELIGAKTKSQDRIIGAHFFSPAHIMPLLEIVRTEKTSKQVYPSALICCWTVNGSKAMCLTSQSITLLHATSAFPSLLDIWQQQFVCSC